MAFFGARPGFSPVMGGRLPARAPMQRPRGGPVRAAGQPLEPNNMIARSPMQRPVTLQGSFKKGGKVRKTGNYKLHKGEVVVPVSRLLRAK